MILPQKAYEIIRWIVAIVIPALITLYGVIGTTLNIPYTEQVLTIAGAVNVALGTIFGISKLQYDAYQNKLEGVLGDGEGEE